MVVARNQINIRLDNQQQALIDRAAKSVGKTRTEFILEASRREAEQVLLSQTVFVLESDAYDLFVSLLDAPTTPNDALRDLLKTQAPWE
ncbi:MAG: DUF1778 domain-containing protein [Thermomicrobiales bacterium]|nr:DUF1778 domain-containing protein [Thermomicrobiales bacterium]MCO5217926.1 DUF1778 domain-containing protein [Thermomicrobiales bacterium]MCO5224208.1 DUF1778 domain-containing protein [Thermomicrobiales bacterium]MCO5228867.1 DUF1778 domain-containing protein [Thermomicrobiales bacterium]